MKTDALRNPDFGILDVSSEAILDGVELIERHNLNATDAAALVTYLRYVHSLNPLAVACLLVTSDHHLLRAAEAEGLRTLNPEVVPPDDVDAILRQDQ